MTVRQQLTRIDAFAANNARIRMGCKSETQPTRIAAFTASKYVNPCGLLEEAQQLRHSISQRNAPVPNKKPRDMQPRTLRTPGLVTKEMLLRAQSARTHLRVTRPGVHSP